MVFYNQSRSDSYANKVEKVNKESLSGEEKGLFLIEFLNSKGKVVNTIKGDGRSLEELGKTIAKPVTMTEGALEKSTSIDPEVIPAGILNKKFVNLTFCVDDVMQQADLLQKDMTEQEAYDFLEENELKLKAFLVEVGEKAIGRMLAGQPALDTQVIDVEPEMPLKALPALTEKSSKKDRPVGSTHHMSDAMRKSIPPEPDDFMTPEERKKAESSVEHGGSKSWYVREGKDATPDELRDAGRPEGTLDFLYEAAAMAAKEVYKSHVSLLRGFASPVDRDSFYSDIGAKLMEDEATKEDAITLSDWPLTEKDEALYEGLFDNYLQVLIHEVAEGLYEKYESKAAGGSRR